MINKELVLGFNGVTARGPEFIHLDLGIFPNNEPMVKAESSHQRFAVQGADFMILRPRSFTDFMSAMFLVDVMDRPIDLYLPAPYGMRMDRKMQGSKDNILFTAKSVAKILNNANLKSVVMIDPHSDVMPALVDKSKVVSLDTVFKKILLRYLKPFDSWKDLAASTVVIAPDAGAVKRASIVAHALGAKLVKGHKMRDTGTGRISHYELDKFDFTDHRILVVDDICDGGATFEILANAVPTKVKSLSLFVTHGLFTKGVKNLLKYYDVIYTTDTTMSACDYSADYKTVKTMPILDYIVRSPT